ncbi:choice-of-anchor A family protein [Sphingomonas sp. BIUV-7]|uniref:Choice-of-anchor A family protein n=1 Tax=Sphingomonas natans TaxID=3063330 RepID=A0ABT8YDP6_9SPHN|nr:collagen-binding domain-containing protein [Sphingomonas sp. BIUV-7]MDO6416455.1 choice-of-anchor A family protein [Sphingomonas sp. BIUV-7]
MRARFALAALACSAGLTIAMPASAATFTSAQYAQAVAGAQKMQELNLVVFGNAASTSEIEGKAFVGGNLSLGGNVGAGADANHQGYKVNADVATLTVGGTASGGIHVKNGIGVPTVTANVGVNSSDTYFDGTTGTLNAGGTISGLNNTGTGNANVAGLKTSIDNQTSTLMSNMSTLSQILASYTANTTFNASDQNNLNFSTASSASLLVASIDGSKLASGTLFLPTLAAGQILVVNVSGNGLTMGANPGGAGNADNQNVIWNFTGTGTMTFNNWNGSILATGATVKNNSQLNGTVVASVFDGHGEVHLGTFSGSLQTLVPAAFSVSAVPETATWMMMILGFGAVGAALRGQRRRAGQLPTR